MPLSEHEQRLLEQMERALYAEDPKFVSSLQHPTQRSGSRRRPIVGFLLNLAGMALLVTGVATKLAPLGVVGFIVMLAGVVIALTGGRARASDDESGTAEAPAKPTNAGSGSGNPAARPTTATRAAAAAASWTGWKTAGATATRKNRAKPRRPDPQQAAAYTSTPLQCRWLRNT